jgi:hypothetical protein
LHSLWRANLQDALTGSYVESGLNASPGSSGTSIQVDVDPGDVRINDSPTSVAGDTLTFDPVSATDEYRADVIYATTSGDLAVEKGNIAQPKPTIDDDDPYPDGNPQPARRLFAPSPPDGSGITGLPIHVVMIADTASDSTDLALEDLVDYRISPPLPGDHTHPEFAKNRRTIFLNNPGGDQYVKLATLNDGTTGPGSAVRFVGWRANERTTEINRQLDVNVETGESNYDVNAFVYGTRQKATDVVVTEESASAAGTPNPRYHLYAHLPSNARTYANMAFIGSKFGEWQYIDGLGLSDLLGSVVWDTGGSTGGPGGELRVPMHANRTVAVENESQFSDFGTGSAAAGSLPRANGNGGFSWEQLTDGPGDYVPITTLSTHQRRYTTTTNTYTFYAQSVVSAPYIQYQNGVFEATGVSLAGTLRAGAQGSAVTAVLAEEQSGPAITGTEIESIETAKRGRESSIVGFQDANNRTAIGLKSVDNEEGTLLSPSITVWGKLPGGSP